MYKYKGAQDPRLKNIIAHQAKCQSRSLNLYLLDSLLNNEQKQNGPDFDFSTYILN